VRGLRFWMTAGVSVGVETGMRKKGEKERRAPSEWQADIMHGTYRRLQPLIVVRGGVDDEPKDIFANDL
jgi:hypothetical protein